MIRRAFTLRLKPGSFAGYKHYHDNIWPDLADATALRQWQQALLRAARHDEHPWNAGLLIENLVTQATAVWPQQGARSALRGGASLHSGR